MLTKLEAVNEVLKAVGETKVNSLDSGLADAEAAQDVLATQTRIVLGKGWACNSDYALKLLPDEAGRIRVPDNVLRIDESTRLLHVTVRYLDSIPYLYNIKEHSFLFARAVSCDIVYLLDFEELTSQLREYITLCAAMEYQQSELASVQIDKMLEKRRAEALAALEDAEADQEDTNVLQQSPHCYAITYRNNSLFGT